MTDINDQRPLEPPPPPSGATAEPTARQRPNPAAAGRSSGVPSVNSRGGRAKGRAPQIFLVGCLGLGLLLIGLIFYRQHQRSQAEAAAAERQAKQTVNTAASVPTRRTFDPTIPPPRPQRVATDCKDSKPMLDANGKPVLSVSGAPMRLCDDGRVVVGPQVPQLQRPMPPPALVQSPPPQREAQKPPSRYGGVTVLPVLEDLAAATRRVAGPNQQSPEDRYLHLLGSHPAGASAPAVTRVSFDGTADAGTEEPRRLAQAAPSNTTSAPPASSYRSGSQPMRQPAGAEAVPDQRQAIGSNLKPSETPRVSATMLGDRNLILPRGRTIDCALGTRVVTEVSGMAECIISSNVYSDNGRVLLIERGSQASGEYRADMAMGQRRLFLLWNRIKTPTGVVIDLNSTSSDALGASGLPGYVDHRWVDRIGAALLVSLVQDALAYGIERERSRSTRDGGYYYNSQSNWAYNRTESTGERIVEEILQQTLQIRPTLYKNQGDRAAIYVARDLDFSPVYELHDSR